MAPERALSLWNIPVRRLLYTIRQALQNYANEGIWKRIQLNGMAKDFSWNISAAEYAKLYEAAKAARNLIPVTTSNP